MRTRLAAIVAAAGIGVAVIPAHAAGVSATTGPAPQVTDVTGDANFLNGQIVNGSPVDNEQTPADVSGADIVSALLQNTFAIHTATKKVTTVVKTKKGRKKVTKTVTYTVKVPTGFTVTLNLSAAPQAATVYRVTAAKGVCTNLAFEYTTSQVTAALGGATDIRCVSQEDTTSYTVAPAVVTGSSITWTVGLGQFPVGTPLTSLGALTAVDSSALNAPFYDLASGSGSFTVGK